MYIVVHEIQCGGTVVGIDVGLEEGSSLGNTDGFVEGESVGVDEGRAVGMLDGRRRTPR